MFKLRHLAVEHNIDTICIQEHRYTYSEDIKYPNSGNGWILATASAWKNSVNATIGAVGTIYQPLGQDMTQGQFLSGV